MSDAIRKSFAEAHEAFDGMIIEDLAQAILAEVADRQGAEIIKPAHHPKSVAAQIYFGGSDVRPGSFYLVDINKDNTVSVAHVIRHHDRGQSCAVKPIRHNICEKSQDEILQIVRDEIQRVTPEAVNKREQEVTTLSL